MIKVKVGGQGYYCHIGSGRLVKVYKEVPQAYLALSGRVELYAVRKLGGLWLRIAALLAEKGELGEY